MLEEQEKREKENSYLYYSPYHKQVTFHDCGLKTRERLFMAGNQLGKTLAGGFEAAIHATGLYPDWWEGKRFEEATVGWASGVTGESTRDNPQRILLGRIGNYGTGYLPKHTILDVVNARGTPNAANFVKVRHISGGDSYIFFKSYIQGREKWQGETVNWIWFDEEPPQDIYSEGLTRTNATKGIVWMTFTPLLGMSEVVRRFLQEKSLDREVVTMTIDDVDHYTEEERQRIINSYPLHEREARAKGIPILGSGRIYPVQEEMILCEPFKIPSYFKQIGGLDFGWDHPTAAVRVVYDSDEDIMYLTSEYKVKEQTPIIHASHLRRWGEFPWAWPQDGLQHDKGSGKRLMELYKDENLDMLKDSARFSNKSNSVEAGIIELLDRMKTGRFKVFNNCLNWLDEFRLYHRKDGKIVKENDDLLDATRYALMCLRFAKNNQKYQKLNMSIKGIV